MKAVSAILILWLAGLAWPAFARNFDGATDLIVFGKVETLKYEVPGDDLVFDGEITARLTVTQVVSGRLPSRTLTIKYIAHTDRPTDYVGHYHLRRSKDGIWLTCSEGGGRGYICR